MSEIRDSGWVERLRLELIAGAGTAVLTRLLATTRIVVTGSEHFERFQRTGSPIVYVLWHGRLLPLTFSRRGEGLATLISLHRDGEYIARVVERWGYHAVRGSSSRGATTALRQLVRCVKDGRSLAITPDGPRGPRETMKPGALLVAQLTGAPVIPVSAGCRRAWWFGSWDRFLVPKPFSRIQVAYGEPVPIPRDVTEGEMRSYEQEIETRLRQLTRSVDDLVGMRPPDGDP